MPEVNFALTGSLEHIAGLGDQKLELLKNGKYPGIPYKVNKLSDIKKEDLIKLPEEAYLTIKHTRGKPYTRAEIEKVGKEIIKRFNIDGELVGSYRRCKTKLNDIDILAVSYTAIHPSADVKIIRSGNVKIKFLYKPKNENEFYPVDIMFTVKDRYPFALLHFTGSKEFNIHMSVHAIKMGMKLGSNGLYKNGKLVQGIKSEKDIFKALKKPYLPPSKRDS
jgi:DNA polymerase/3'-5' exonuclease PolX